MNLKRAIWVSALMYLVSLIIGIAATIITGQTPEQIAEMPTNFMIMGIVTSVILVALFSLLYFKKGKGVKPNAKEGAYFGITAILTGFVLDLVIALIAYLVSGTFIDILSYYKSIFFWAAVVLVIITGSIVGKIKAK